MDLASETGGTVYTSPWKPTYDTWSWLRCLSNPDSAPSGEAAVRSALHQLIPDELTSGTFATNCQPHRFAAKQGMRDAFQVAIDQWGEELDKLYSVREAWVSPESGVYEDVYHLALALAVGRARPVPRWAWLSADGMMPQLPEDLGLNITVGDLEKAAKFMGSADWEARSFPRQSDLGVAAGAKQVARTWFQGSVVRVFRGQKRGCPPWQLATSLDRILDGEARSRLARRTAQVTGAVARQCGIGFQHALALVQHYSTELGLATRLLDVTVDPFVALYFAANPTPESDAEEGVIYRWSMSELKDDPEMLGSLRLVMPPGEPRLLRQRGLFLEAPIPWALEQTWAFDWRFKQRRGLRFEDPGRGITKANLEPLSPWHDRLVFAMQEDVEPSAEELDAVAGTPAEGQELLERCLYGYLARCQRSAPPGRIALLALFHWAVTERIPPGELVRSLRRAKQTAEVIAEPNAVPRDIPSTYYRQCASADDGWMFWMGDFVDFALLSQKLTMASRPFDAWLSGQLSPATLRALKAAHRNGFDPRPVQRALLVELNQMLQEASLYDPQRFAGIELREETKAMVMRLPQGTDRKRLNRFLIEDAYPTELSRNPEGRHPLWKIWHEVLPGGQSRPKQHPVGDPMTLVTHDTEPLSLTRAWIGDLDGLPTPMAEIDGRICLIETKDTLLALGIASCVPATPTGDDWPHAVQIREDGSTEVRTLCDATSHAGVVAAARTWARLAAADEIQLGTSLL